MIFFYGTFGDGRPRNEADVTFLIFANIKKNANFAGKIPTLHSVPQWS